MTSPRLGAPRTLSHQEREYVARVNRVLDHIEQHLHQPLSVEELAAVANFSKFHFHRIFRAALGEPLHQFIGRLRVERAAMRLRNEPDRSLTEIAIDCGFNSSATFSRAFRAAFDTTPTQWRSKNCKTLSKIAQTSSQPMGATNWYFDGHTHQLVWREDMNQPASLLQKPVEVAELPELTVAYVRHVGPYAGDSTLFRRLFAQIRNWVATQGLLTADTQFLTVSHDDPEVTDPEKLRISVCATVPADTQAAGDIGVMTVPGGKFAVGAFELPPQQIAAAWQEVMGRWLPQSGFQPDNRYCYEVSLNNPAEHPEGKLNFEIRIPVAPLV